MNPQETFLESVAESRKVFVEAINNQNWNTQTRTQAESLLIVFDQMKTRLEEKVADDQHEMVYWKEKYFDLLDKWKHFKPLTDDNL